MAKKLGICGLALILVSVLPAWAGKPKPPDAVPPDPISDLGVMAAARSLTLRFTATGDDGTSGTAAAYDVLYAATGSCSGPPESWPGVETAERSELQVPIAAGSADAFTVRPLSAGTAYCVAIRVVDEAANASAWATESATTLGAAGNAPFAPIPPDESASPNPANLSAEGLVAVADEAPASGEPRILAAWAIADHAIASTSNHRIGIRFAALAVPSADAGPIEVCPAATDCAETILLSGSLLSPHLDALSGALAVASIPGNDGVAGILVRGTKAAAKRNQPAQPRTVLLERSAAEWTSSLLPFDVAGGTAPALIYVPSAGGGFEPVVTWVRADPSGSTLMLAERSGGAWTSTELFSRAQGGFLERLLFTTPAGDLGVWASATPAGPEPAIYALRSPAGAAGSWTFYDAGPRDSNVGARYHASAFDGDGELVVATAPHLGSEVLAIHQADFAGPFAGLPPADFSGSLPVSAWSQIVSPVPGAGSARVAGLSADPCDGRLQVVARSSYPLPTSSDISELRVASYNGVAPAASDPVDHVSSGTPAAVGLPNGDVAVLTTWAPFDGNPVRYTSRPAQDVYLMRGLVGSCPAEP